MRVDVTDPATVGRGLDIGCSRPAPPRIVISCAGGTPSALTLSRGGQHDLDMFERVVRVNLIGTSNLPVLPVARITAPTPADSGRRRGITNTVGFAVPPEGGTGLAVLLAQRKYMNGKVVRTDETMRTATQ